MQVLYEKIAILDERLVLASITAGPSRVINIWTDGPVQLIACKRRPSRATNNGRRATHQWILFIMTQTDDVTQKTNPQKIFDPLIWRPINISPPKVQKPTFWTELYTLQSCKISRRSTLNNCPRAKIHTFLIGDSPGELLSHAIHVRKLPSS